MAVFVACLWQNHSLTDLEFRVFMDFKEIEPKVISNVSQQPMKSPCRRKIAQVLQQAGVLLVITPAVVVGQNLPRAYTQPTSPVSSNSVVLHGMVTPRGAATEAWFEWGDGAILSQTTPPQSVGNGLNLVRVTVPMSGLVPNHDYRCRIVASNVNGVVFGPVSIFTTGRRAASWAHTGTWTSGPPPAGLHDVAKIAYGDLQGIALRTDGTLKVWGRYYLGLVSTNLFVPPGLSNVVHISGGSYHCLVAKSDGTLTGWAVAATAATNAPASATNVIAVESGSDHGVALRGDGSVVAWGGTSFSTIPSGATNIVSIASGDFHCLALRHDGQVFMWGGSLWEGWNAAIPPGTTNIIAIAAAYRHSMALRADGMVLTWGRNDYGQVPPPANLSNVVAIAAGAYQSMALKNDGTVVVWGQSLQGQTNIPAGLSNVVGIASGDYACLALAPNVPPQAAPVSFTGAQNRQTIVTLRCPEPNGYPVAFRIDSLPAKGSLCQYTTNGCGPAITLPGTPVLDAGGRVIFTPEADEAGVPYTAFDFQANDGEFDSPTMTMTANIIPAPTVTYSSTGSSVRLGFSSASNLTFYVYASTNLVNWTFLSVMTQPTPGDYLYNDTSISNLPRRFYRVRTP